MTKLINGDNSRWNEEDIKVATILYEIIGFLPYKYDFSGERKYLDNSYLCNVLRQFYQTFELK